MAGISSTDSYDVIIVGGGNTALLTALRAHEAGAKVLILEKALKQFRGGNGYFTTGIYRVAHNGMADVLDLMPDLTEEERGLDIQAYTEQDFFNEWTKVCEGLVDPQRMEMIIGQSNDAVRWMVKEQGLKMELAAGSVRRVDDKLRFRGVMPIQAKGAGAGLSDTIYSVIEDKGIELLYETGATRLLVGSKGRVVGVSADRRGETQDIKAKSVILSCGGFESNPMWRARYLGKDWDLAKVRGTRYNMGDGLRMAMEIGGQPTGHWSCCHAIFIDADAPQPAIREDTEKTSKRIYIFGLVFNVEGKRFVDEGEDEVAFTYARYGKHALAQPQRIAFQLFDSKTHPFISSFSDYMGAPHIKGDTIEEIADQLAVDPDALAKTVKEYNAASKPGGTLPLHELMGDVENREAFGISPPKSNCAFPVDTPPFYVYSVCCGITFTFGGLKVNDRAQVVDIYDNPIPGLYASGEIIGGLFYNNYPGATGLTAGAVFARIAGANAAAD